MMSERDRYPNLDQQLYAQMVKQAGVPVELEDGGELFGWVADGNSLNCSWARFESAQGAIVARVGDRTYGLVADKEGNGMFMEAGKNGEKDAPADRLTTANLLWALANPDETSPHFGAAREAVQEEYAPELKRLLTKNGNSAPVGEIVDMFSTLGGVYGQTKTGEEIGYFVVDNEGGARPATLAEALLVQVLQGKQIIDTTYSDDVRLVAKGTLCPRSSGLPEGATLAEREFVEQAMETARRTEFVHNAHAPVKVLVAHTNMAASNERAIINNIYYMIEHPPRDLDFPPGVWVSSFTPAEGESPATIGVEMAIANSRARKFAIIISSIDQHQVSVREVIAADNKNRYAILPFGSSRGENELVSVGNPILELVVLAAAAQGKLEEEGVAKAMYARVCGRPGGIHRGDIIPEPVLESTDKKQIGKPPPYVQALCREKVIDPNMCVVVYTGEGQEWFVPGYEDKKKRLAWFKVCHRESESGLEPNTYFRVVRDEAFADRLKRVLVDCVPEIDERLDASGVETEACDGNLRFLKEIV